MAKNVNVQIVKKKGPPRGRPFSKDNPPPKPFVKGQSGNPGGRPKGSGSKTLSAAYNAALCQAVPRDVREKLGIDLDADCSWADLIALQMVRKSVETDGAKIHFGAVTELRETTEGKTPERQELSGAKGAPLNVPPFQVQFVKPADGDNSDVASVVDTGTDGEGD